MTSMAFPVVPVSPVRPGAWMRQGLLMWVLVLMLLGSGCSTLAGMEGKAGSGGRSSRISTQTSSGADPGGLAGLVGAAGGALRRFTDLARSGEVDPFEETNRRIFRFNEKLDRYVLRPVAVVYDVAAPEVVRFLLGNFFSNLEDAYTAANNLMQLKFLDAASDLGRVAINSSFGFLGVADIASDLGLQKHQEDFGQTLGYWGVPSGPYLMLPFFGPSSLRDAPALLVDSFGDPVAWHQDVAVRNAARAVRLVQGRADLMQGERLLGAAALDRYSLIRDGWLQRRDNAVRDGKAAPAGDGQAAETVPDYDDFDPGPTQ